MSAVPPPSPQLLRLAALVQLEQRARLATPAELAFVIVNETHGLLAYRQAVLFDAGGRVEAVSGVALPDADGPYLQWLARAFAALPAGTVDTLLKPENKDQLTKILTCHVVAAKANAEMVKAMIQQDGGKHVIKTVGGCEFTAMSKDGKVMIEDGQGNVATVTIADVMQSNGVIHVIDTVLLPAS